MIPESSASAPHLSVQCCGGILCRTCLGKIGGEGLSTSKNIISVCSLLESKTPHIRASSTGEFFKDYQSRLYAGVLGYGNLHREIK